MTEQELTALAKHYGRMEGRRDDRFIDTEALAQGYLAILAERDALTMASDVSVTNARLALNDWHQCSTPEELARWRAAQARLIIAAKASVKPEVDALMAERDTLKAQAWPCRECEATCPHGTGAEDVGEDKHRRDMVRQFSQYDMDIVTKPFHQEIETLKAQLEKASDALQDLAAVDQSKPLLEQISDVIKAFE